MKEEREGAKSKPKEDGRCVLCSRRGGGTTCYVVYQYPEIMCFFDGKFNFSFTYWVLPWLLAI